MILSLLILHLKNQLLKKEGIKFDRNIVNHVSVNYVKDKRDFINSRYKSPAKLIFIKGKFIDSFPNTINCGRTRRDKFK